jgi:hypothetical protein
MKLRKGRKREGDSARARRKARARRRIDSRRQVRYAQVLGILFCTAGFLAIGLGWAGMASRACADCQLPYLLSGGAAGLGLIVFGVTLLILAQVRTERVLFVAKLEEVLKEAKPKAEPRPAQEAATSTPSPSSGNGGAVRVEALRVPEVGPASWEP